MKCLLLRILFVAALAALPVRTSWGFEAPVPEARGTAPGSGAEGLIASLRSRILAAHSATFALEAWCADHRLSADSRVVAERLAVPDKPPSAAQRARLAIGPDEPVRYRRVRLACGDRVLSEADNWYVPARLTPEMNAALDGTRTPFGRVVRALAPVRRTVEVRTPEGGVVIGPSAPLFEVDAVLSTGSGEPFCEVVETYLSSALPQASR
ncbi:MAG: hypothetical protein INR63_19980 [Actinomycetospora chiangmaiensis]|nr:hypothetical protein [Actinomycetospora chiangmaiensis]